MTGQSELRQKILQAFEEVLGPVLAKKAAKDVDLLKNGILDSFAMIELVSAIEVGCGVVVASGELNADNLRNVESIERMVARLKVQ